MSFTRSFRVTIVVAGLVMVPAHPVAAVSSVTTGWWTTASTPVPPDVPPDGLLVQSIVTPVAYAAVSFVLGPTERPDTLTLTVAEGAASNPVSVLRLCPLSEPLHPAQGGSADAAPAYDCAQFVDATPAAGAYAFDVTKLPATRTLAVAVLPTGPIDRVILEGPKAASLSTRGTDAPTPPPSTVPSATSPTEAEPVDAPATVPGVEIGPLHPPTVTSAAPEPPAVSGDQEVAESSQLGVRSTSTTSMLARALLAIALGVALVLWLIAGSLANNRARRDLRQPAAI